ncbi:halocyanin domain-containing protein [Halobellus ruber]|uniref:Halocyanin domain-containing protein n=1 Tax=Halobellus ruber TaxID=2761102 RepID=A0A7J9SKB3_9EURY|nr:halocyanin domain-containing protein [Halobellus ruber]MBB6646823.1 halocyanin domain-containing protein [Halobellus ruber]
MCTSGQAPTDGEEPTDDGRGDGPAVSRRGALRAIGGGVAAGAALSGASTTVRAQSDGPDLASWFESVSNYDGVVDETGSSSVTVEVGVEANGGAFGFGPAAVRVDPGTTVTWTWTGKGGSHNVAGDGFESELTDSGDYTFEHTFEDAGVYTYVCTPHETLGMKGAVVVGDVAVNAGGGSSTEGGSTESAGDGGGTGTPSGDSEAAAEETLGPAEESVAAPFGDAGARRLGGLALGGVFGLALASPGLFGAFLWLTDRGNERPDDET